MLDGGLSDFRELLKRESQRKTGRVISSSTPEQAAVVLEVFFATATSAVRIVTGGLNARVYGHENVIVEAKKFLADRSRSLQILFLNPMPPKLPYIHPLIGALLQNDNLVVMQADDEVNKVMRLHFSVVDMTAFRLKKDTDAHASIVSFGDTTLSNSLVSIFSELEKRSQKIELPDPEWVRFERRHGN
jgi:hypothetical protein